MRDTVKDTVKAYYKEILKGVLVLSTINRYPKPQNSEPY